MKIINCIKKKIASAKEVQSGVMVLKIDGEEFAKEVSKAVLQDINGMTVKDDEKIYKKQIDKLQNEIKELQTISKYLQERNKELVELLYESNKCVKKLQDKSYNSCNYPRWQFLQQKKQPSNNFKGYSFLAASIASWQLE